MPFHLHTIRSGCAAAIIVALAVALLGGAYAPEPDDLERATVTGRVSCGGRPLGGMWAIFQATDPHGYATGTPVLADGSFRMDRRDNKGLVPGTYRVCFYRPDGPVPAIDLVARVGPDWNDIDISLPGPGRGPVLAQRQQGEGL